MELIFEKSVKGRSLDLLPECDVPVYSLPERREAPLELPAVSENDISRHYTALAKRAHGVNDGFYPLGSCTMKYNPKIDEEAAVLPGFTGIHPLQCQASSQGCLQVMYECADFIREITGMDAVTLQPAAGAHGEFTGILLIKAYHVSRGDAKRDKIIVPDSAHGTNPASAAMAGYTVISIPSAPDGCVDLDALRAAVGEDTAGLMLTNPNTVGLFDRNILEITKIVHDAGGLCYYDGANLNAIMGVARPGDMGFDVFHTNLHKTFATPHGGGGPGSGPVGCKAFLEEFLPSPIVKKEGETYSLYAPERSIGSVRAFYGNFLVIVKALAYMKTLGGDGLREASVNAVLNANYMMKRLSGSFDMAFDRICMHEFVMSLEKLKKEVGVSALDVAKALLDYGIHPPTMYFPLIVHEALMIEPTETESRETLDRAADVFLEILKAAKTHPESLHDCPKITPVGRLDEVTAARKPVLKYEPEQN